MTSTLDDIARAQQQRTMGEDYLRTVIWQTHKDLGYYSVLRIFGEYLTKIFPKTKLKERVK